MTDRQEHYSETTTCMIPLPKILSMALNCITKTSQNIQVVLFIDSLAFWCILCMTKRQVKKKLSDHFHVGSPLCLTIFSLGDDGDLYCNSALISRWYPYTQDFMTSYRDLKEVRIIIYTLKYVLCTDKTDFFLFKQRQHKLYGHSVHPY